jgi:hypothetical protein
MASPASEGITVACLFDPPCESRMGGSEIAQKGIGPAIGRIEHLAPIFEFGGRPTAIALFRMTYAAWRGAGMKKAAQLGQRGRPFRMVGVARIELATPTMSIVFNTLITLPYSCFYHIGIVTGMLKFTTGF